MPEFIDRDLALEEAKKSYLFFSIKPILEKLPAADVREVVRGGWEEHGEPNERGKYELWYYSCTRCGAVGIPQFNYCHNCGAMMVKGEADGNS